MENKAEIYYELGPNDVKSYLDYTWNNSKKSRSARKLIRILGVTIGLLAVISAIILPLSGQLDIFTSVVLGIVGLYVILFAIFWVETWKRIIYRPVMRGYSRKPNTVIGKHRLSITPDGINDVNEIGQMSTHWNGIHRYASNDQFLFLYGYVNTFYIVPRRAFPDERSFNQFIETVKFYKKH
jgi:YcxB-like protein